MDYNFALMKNLGPFLAAAFVLAAVPAPAADKDITIFGAVQYEEKLTFQSATQAGTTLSTFDPGTFSTFGVRFGHGNVVGGEHTIAYVPNFIDTKSKAVVYTSNFLLQAPLPKAKPYATVGLGSFFSFGSGLGDLGSKFALNYGGGVKVLPAGPVGLRLDIRGYAIPGVRFTGPGVTGVSPSKQTMNILEAGIGIIFSLGK